MPRSRVSPKKKSEKWTSEDCEEFYRTILAMGERFKKTQGEVKHA
jgi:hypothetical protein